MIWAILFIIILIIITIFSLVDIAPFTPSDDDLQWEEIQKWKERNKNA